MKRIIGEVEINTGKVGGEPVIRGTRVTVKQFVDYLKADTALQEACEDFGVQGPQLERLLDEMFTAFRDQITQEVAHEGVA